MINKAGIRTQILCCDKCKKELSRCMRYGKRNTTQYVSYLYCNICNPNEFPWD